MDIDDLVQGSSYSAGYALMRSQLFMGQHLPDVNIVKNGQHDWHIVDNRFKRILKYNWSI